MSDRISVAIIGAGISGLAAAHSCLESGLAVHLYEETAVAGGRIRTRRREGFAYDDGAQYVKQMNKERIHLITERFLTPDLITIEKPVWIFNKDNSIQAGDVVQNADPRWCYRDGMDSLPNSMARNLPILFQTRIERIQQTSHGWSLFTARERITETYDRLLITLPPRQARALIANSELHTALQSHIQIHLASSIYHPVLSIALGYAKQPATRPYYSLVSTDKQHALSWLAWEHEKTPERAPKNGGLLIAQMAPDYSRTHVEDENVVQDVAAHISTLLQEDLREPTFSDVHYWPDALPAGLIDTHQLNHATLPHGLAFCGDGFVGGRVQLAFEHGIEVSQQLITSP